MADVNFSLEMWLNRSMEWVDTHDGLLWMWYLFMCLFSCINLLLCVYFLMNVVAKDRYGRLMKWLAVPYVLECAWRCFFPSLYLQRYVFWDTPANSIMVDRTLACVGELTWTAQIAFALMYVDVQINKKATSWIQASGVLAILVYVVAEGCSYYNVATTNEFWCAVEVIIDGLSFLCMAPGAIYLLCKCPGRIRDSTAKIFLLIGSVVFLMLPYYNTFNDAPLYIRRYNEDQANHKKYLGFIEGLVDATQRRVVAHRLDQWREDLFWMTVYFTVGSLSSILLMLAPRLNRNHGDEDNGDSGKQLLQDQDGTSYDCEKQQLLQLQSN